MLVPQFPLDDREFVKGIDDDASFVFGRVELQDISTAAVFGGAATSTSVNSIGYGLKTFTLDIDDGKVANGVGIEMQADDHDCFMFGVIVARDTSVSPVAVTSLITSKSATDGQFSNWDIQITHTPLSNFSPNAVVGASIDTITIPANGETVAANILPNKLVSRNVSVLFTDATNTENYFRLRVTSYDEDTGDVEGICTAKNGTGDSSAWIVSLIPGPVSGGNVSPITLVKQAEATGTDPATFTFPADIIAGDLLVATTHADYTVPIVVSNGMYCKIADGSESGAVGWAEVSDFTAIYQEVNARQTDTGPRYTCLVFRPDNPAVSFATGSVGHQTTSGNPSAQVVTSSSGDTPVVVIGLYASDGDVSPRSMAPAKDGETAVSTKMYTAWKIYNTAPADVTVDMDDEGLTNTLMSCYISVYGLPNEPGDVVIFEDDGAGNPQYPAADGTQITGLYASPTTTAGDIIYNSTGTDGVDARLGIGTLNQVLRVNAAATAPEWTNGWKTVASGSFPAAATLSVSIPAGYSDIMATWTGVSSNTATRILRVQPNADTTAGNYIYSNINASAGTIGVGGQATLAVVAAATAAQTTSGSAVVHGYATAGFKFFTGTAIDGGGGIRSAVGFWAVTNAVTTIDFIWDGSGNFDAGTYVVSVK